MNFEIFASGYTVILKFFYCRWFYFFLFYVWIMNNVVRKHGGKISQNTLVLIFDTFIASFSPNLFVFICRPVCLFVFIYLQVPHPPSSYILILQLAFLVSISLSKHVDLFTVAGKSYTNSANVAVIIGQSC